MVERLPVDTCHARGEAKVAKTTQLPGAIQVEERGEFGEAREGNPEPSPMSIEK